MAETMALCKLFVCSFLVLSVSSFQPPALYKQVDRRQSSRYHGVHDTRQQHFRIHSQQLTSCFAGSTESGDNIHDFDENEQAKESQQTSESSKREMLKFAVPALGIYLMQPLLSNIDNSFVGRTVGKTGLAALSPATLCIDQALYLFSFLSRATTGLASRAYSSNSSNADEPGNVEAARDAASPALTVSLFCGAALTLMYSFRTPALLQLLNVDPMLRTSTTSYIHWRGATAWAAMAQNVCLSLFMVTRDVLTPLKIIGTAAIVNVIGDAMFCVWPIRGGCGGAAAATTIATLISSSLMVNALKKKKLLPALRIPKKSELAALGQFTGPLLAITLTRMAGFLNMQRRAMELGVTALAGYQLTMNLLVFFILFGEPLSQLGQTQLPGLIEDGNKKEAMETLKSILMLSVFAAVGVGAAAYFTSIFGAGLFSPDISVQAEARGAAPMLFLAVAMTIMGIAIDGAMMASRDFGMMLCTGIFSFFIQAQLLKSCNSVTAILATFAIRLGSYTLFSVIRAFATNLGIRQPAKQLA